MSEDTLVEKLLMKLIESHENHEDRLRDQEEKTCAMDNEIKALHEKKADKNIVLHKAINWLRVTVLAGIGSGVVALVTYLLTRPFQ